MNSGCLFCCPGVLEPDSTPDKRDAQITQALGSSDLSLVWSFSFWGGGCMAGGSLLR